MKGAREVGEYKPTGDFEEFHKDFDINIADDKELWLIQWPLNSAPDIDGQTLSLNLHHNGLLGTFEGSTGKQYEVVSNEPQKSGATVFLPSSSECQIVGKISRQVSILHYPDPKELSESNLSVYKKMAERSAASSLTGSASRYSTPTHGMRSRSSGLNSGLPSSMLSGRTGTIASGGSRDTSKPPLKRHSDKSFHQESKRETDSGTPSGSLEQSQERKSKKKRKSEV